MKFPKRHAIRLVMFFSRILFYVLRSNKVLRRLFDNLRFDIFSIGIYRGPSPFSLAPLDGANPVLTAAHVTDAPALFVADPFLLRRGSKYFMFFEVWNTATRKGEIGLAISDDCVAWVYQKIVLAEDFHLSYPYVFTHDGTVYMIPETCGTKSLRLYAATSFPFEWKLAATLLEGHYNDPSIFEFDGKWWLFAETNVKRKNDTLMLYYADRPGGPWRAHKEQPILVDAMRARPGGRVVAHDSSLFRFAQQDTPLYGLAIRAFRICKLTALEYQEAEISEKPFLQGSGTGWNARGMHHIDLLELPDGSWIGALDGWTNAYPGVVFHAMTYLVKTAIKIVQSQRRTIA